MQLPIRWFKNQLPVGVLGSERRFEIISPSIVQRILQLFPEPNQGAPGQVFSNYTIPSTSTTNNTTHCDLRLDYNPSSKDQAFVRYSYSNNPTTYGSGDAALIYLGKSSPARGGEHDEVPKSLAQGRGEKVGWDKDLIVDRRG